jgi:flagellar protein FlbD
VFGDSSGGLAPAPHPADHQRAMIALRRLNNQTIMVNPDLIETLEATPDTVVTLTNGNKLIVRDTMDEIRDKIVEFKRRIHGPDAQPAGR